MVKIGTPSHSKTLKKVQAGVLLEALGTSSGGVWMIKERKTRACDRRHETKARACDRRQ